MNTQIRVKLVVAHVSESSFTNPFVTEPSYSVLDFGVEHIDVAGAEMLAVKVFLGAAGLTVTLEEDEGVAGGAAIGNVDNDITLSDAEVTEEVTDLTNASGVGQGAELQALVLVFLVHVVGETGALGVARALGLANLIVVSLVATASTATTTASTIRELLVSTSTTAAVATAASSSTFVTATVSIGRAIELSSLVLFESNVLSIGDLEELDPSSSNVLLVAIAESHLAVFVVVEQDASLTGQLAIGHLADFDGVFVEAKAVEELNNVVMGDGVGETTHLHSSLLDNVLDFLSVEVSSSICTRKRSINN